MQPAAGCCLLVSPSQPGCPGCLASLPNQPGCLLQHSILEVPAPKCCRLFLQHCQLQAPWQEELRRKQPLRFPCHLDQTLEQNQACHPAGIGLEGRRGSEAGHWARCQVVACSEVIFQNHPSARSVQNSEGRLRLAPRSLVDRRPSQTVSGVAQAPLAPLQSQVGHSCSQRARTTFGGPRPQRC